MFINAISRSFINAISRSALFLHFNSALPEFKYFFLVRSKKAMDENEQSSPTDNTLQPVSFAIYIKNINVLKQYYTCISYLSSILSGGHPI